MQIMVGDDLYVPKVKPGEKYIELDNFLSSVKPDQLFAPLLPLLCQLGKILISLLLS